MKRTQDEGRKPTPEEIGAFREAMSALMFLPGERDYVVSGGELPALVLIDALARLQPRGAGRRALERR